MSGGYRTVVVGTDGSETSLRLIVLGNRGLNTLAGRLVGSVPLDVIRNAPVDVLVVHTT